MRSIVRVWRGVDVRPFEEFLAGLALVWAVSLLCPGMGQGLAFASYWWCGLLIALIGSLRVYGLVRDRVWARLISAMTGGVIWSFVGLSLLIARSAPLAWAYGVLSLANLIVFVKICRVELPPRRGEAVG